MRDRFVTNVTIQCVRDALNSPRRRSYPQKVSLCSLCMHRVPPNRPVRNNLPSRHSLSLVLPLLVSLSSSLSPELRYIRTNSDWPWTYRRGRSSSHSNATIFLSLSLSLLRVRSVHSTCIEEGEGMRSIQLFFRVGSRKSLYLPGPDRVLSHARTWTMLLRYVRVRYTIVKFKNSS